MTNPKTHVDVSRWIVAAPDWLDPKWGGPNVQVVPAGAYDQQRTEIERLQRLVGGLQRVAGENMDAVATMRVADPELAPGGSQAQPNTAAPESGTGAASQIHIAALREAREYILDNGDERSMAPVIERIDNALRGQSEPEAEPRCHCATVHYPGCEYVEWARTHLNRNGER